ncbi:hypothetical protein ACLB1R_26875 [Escherichia coli]
MVSWCHHLPGEQGRFYALKGQMPEDEMAFRSSKIRSNQWLNFRFQPWMANVIWW